MADKIKQKKRNLDEVDPLMLASVLNPDLAVAVEQAQQQPQAEVRPARTTRRRVTDEIVGSVKAQLEGKTPVRPWLAYPAAAAVAGTVLNPLTAAESYILGGLGSAAVDKGTKAVTGKPWGKLVSDAADINPEVASVTNPGYLLGGVPITKRSIDTVRALRDASKHGGTLEPNAFGRFIIGGLRRLSNRGKGTQGAQAHYKGVALPTQFDPDYKETSKKRIVKAIKALGENYAKKYNTENPFEDIENELDVRNYGTTVPAFIIEKLKLGGYVPRRTLATGGSIHINPANRGKFNATKARTGKTTEELTHSKNPLTRKRAIFAQNAAKWHH